MPTFTDNPSHMVPLFSSSVEESQGEDSHFTTPPRHNNNSKRDTTVAAAVAQSHPFSVNDSWNQHSTHGHVPFTQTQGHGTNPSPVWKEEVESRAREKREESAVLLCEALGVSFHEAMTALDTCQGTVIISSVLETIYVCFANSNCYIVITICMLYYIGDTDRAAEWVLCGSGMRPQQQQQQHIYPSTKFDSID